MEQGWESRPAPSRACVLSHSAIFILRAFPAAGTAVLHPLPSTPQPLQDSPLTYGPGVNPKSVTINPFFCHGLGSEKNMCPVLANVMGGDICWGVLGSASLLRKRDTQKRFPFLLPDDILVLCIV